MAARCKTRSPAAPPSRSTSNSGEWRPPGQTERAATELAEARRLSGDDRFSSLARLRAVENYEGLVPKVHALLEATYIAGLRKTGMPEE